MQGDILVELMYWVGGSILEANLKWVTVIMEDNSDCKKVRGIMDVSNLTRFCYCLW